MIIAVFLKPFYNGLGLAMDKRQNAEYEALARNQAACRFHAEFMENRLYLCYAFESDTTVSLLPADAEEHCPDKEH